MVELQSAGLTLFMETGRNGVLSSTVRTKEITDCPLMPREIS
jgi:hypothetical protein